ncbi:MAG: hypothetical protein WCV64_10415 [Desulfurivibrionaceae bacterium]|jgi:hypothetical protein
MSIIGQPDSYQDMLKRIFYVSVITGIGCTAGIALASPSFKAFLDSWSLEADLGPLKSVKALYVLIPLGIALISRVFLLHDKLQKIFGLRKLFEEKYILQSLAKNVELSLDGQQKYWMGVNRNDLLYQAFYPYASFKDPVIDRQLVYTAADRWGWFWAAMESSFILLISSIIFFALSAWLGLAIAFGIALLLILFMFYQWTNLIESAEAQVKAIGLDAQRQTEIVRIFQKLCVEPKKN